MKSGRVKGGPALPATIDTGRRMRSNMAQPVFNASGLNRGIIGGAAQNIIQITSEDLVQNGGQYKLMGGPAVPMEIVTGRRSIQGAAQVVYPVDILGNYDPSFAGYIYKVLTANPAAGYSPSGLIGFWPQNELAGGVSYDHSGLGHHGAYTGVTLGQPGVPGMGMTSPLYDGANDYNNIYGAPLANNTTLLNGGFETPGGGGADIWANYTEVAGDGALANEVVIVHQGTDSCKMTSGATSNTKAEGDAMVSVPGEVRRFRFYTYGDGVNAGRYGVYDVTNGADIIAPTTTGITAAAWGMVAVQYTVPAGCISVRIDYWCPPVNGGVCYYDAGEVRGMDGFLGDQGTVIVPAQVANAGVWTDGLNRMMLAIKVDGENFIDIRRSPANNTITFYYEAGNVNDFINVGALTSLAYIFYGITWDISAGATGEMRVLVDGVQSGATQVGLGTWVGDLSNVGTVIGANATVPGFVWSGNIGPVLSYNTVKTPAEMLYLSEV